MSFFDEDSPPRRATPPRRRSAPPRGPGGTEPQAVMVRRAVALGGGALLLVLLLFAINSCRGSAQENSLKDYNRSVASIAESSDSQVGQPFFRLLSGDAAGSPTDLQTAVASLRVEAEGQLEQAQELDVPDEMVPAHRSLLIVLELRRDGLDFIGQRVRAALGAEGDAADEAAEAIAGQMQAFLASDVLYRTRVQLLIRQALDDAEIGGQTVPPSRFVPSLEWLSPQTVAARLEGGGGGDAAANEGEPAPGTHGTGLEAVSVGELTLEPGAANRIPVAGAPPTFSVRFANQGENDEQDVRVEVRVEGSGRPIVGTDTIDAIAQGASATAEVRLPQTPPTGAAVTIRVRVRAVPGEEMTENNEQEYPAQFTG